MQLERFTMVCDFRGGTYISQVTAHDPRDAIAVWAALLRRDRPLEEASVLVAQAVDANPDDIVPLSGLTGAWCWSEVVDSALVLVNIIKSASS